ncbi:MAG: tRNA 2-selenouridine(34) synthase MnmH [Roseinatronobacter sp.]
MSIRFDTLADLLARRYDDVIDVRSPAEFMEDHIPGAINLPALSDEERARVGTIYTQVSPFDARKIGAALVARNVATHLETVLNDRDGSWQPLIYCWRGGQRSGSVATILKAVGWRVETIAGGYQSFRRLIHTPLYASTLSHRVILLDGYTGTAKTELLHRLAGLGVQVLDLERMARHRGSILGGHTADQPSQKAFETAIACRLAVLDPERPIVMEAESSKIGDRIIPPALWAAMKHAPRIEINAPIDARASYLVEAYAEIIAQHDYLTSRLSLLRHHQSAAKFDHWMSLLNEGAHVILAQALMQDHYDPSYAKSRGRHAHRTLATITARDLSPPDRDAIARQIMDIITAES